MAKMSISDKVKMLMWVLVMVFFNFFLKKVWWYQIYDSSRYLEIRLPFFGKISPWEMVN